MKIDKLYRMFFIVILIIFFICCKQNIEVNSLPNVIIILTDDQGYSDLGCYGADGFTTPNIDKMAETGIRFTNFYAPATVCTPSRAGLLTGQYPKRSNLHEAVLFPFSTNGLSEEKYTMAEMFKDNGYSTYCIGKWHLGHLEEYMPNNHGFDYFYGVPYSNDMDSYFYSEINFQSPPLPFYKNKELIEEGPNQDSLTIRYTEEVIKIIKNQEQVPFFIYLAHNMPHKPWHVSDNFKGKSEIGLYGDVIMELDWSVGQIIKALKERDIYENTILVFTSDNGPVSNNSAKPLRGIKATTWEGGQRVPGIIIWPSIIKGNVVCDEMVTSMDLFPTFMDIINGDKDDNLEFDGISIKELLENPLNTKLPIRPFVYFARNGNFEAIRYGDWKLHVEKSLGWDEKKLGDFPISLYNLKNDINESINLKNNFSDTVSILNSLLIELNHKIQ